MKNFRFFAVALMAIMVMVSCSKDEDSTPKTLTVSPTGVSIAKDGGSSQITVTSNTDWTATSSTGWCTVSPASGSSNGSISVTCTANSETARVATITISGTGITAPFNVSVNQAGETVSSNPFIGAWKDEAYPNGSFLQYTFNADMSFQLFYYDGLLGTSETETGSYAYQESISQLTFVVEGIPDNTIYQFVNTTTLKIGDYTYFKQ